ncbi:hypothetical protein O0I10_003828 [Lichtheimia ornata]|uniref:Uncharacterized protein n=1 Tax=Lichtheimia ornata TaxID=688661 RepID=A0AAD7VA51_9FUNG|nr:uncharacterized protein O0I10_003828 [Lichtheimia ornata]KAJ8660371.1 hypothetical protein O0I10_003828 [Lichtheimia ornata]
MEPTNESELITRYLLPAFQALFDDDKRKTLIRWTATQSVDTKQSSSSSSSRPDCIISVLKNSYPYKNVGFGEVKSPFESGNHHAVNKDLYRLGLFCKTAINDAGLRACLALHAVGLKPHTFYFGTASEWLLHTDDRGLPSQYASFC